MKLSKNVMRWLCGAVAVPFLLAGCANGDDGSGSSSQNTGSAGGFGEAQEGSQSSESEKSENSESSTADSGEEEKGGEIVYWSMWESTEPQAIAIQQIADEYELETGIKVNIEWKGRSGITDGIIPALDSGIHIDMFDQSLWRVAAIFGDHCLDIEDLVEKSGYADTANEFLLQYSRETSEGVLKVIPYQINTYCFWYNEDIFDEAGVTEKPKTWEEFLDVCRKVKDAGYIPVTTDDAYALNMWNWHIGRLVGEEAEKKISDENLWDDPAVLKAATDFAEMASKGYFSPHIGSNVWPNGQNVEFGGGQAAMYLCASYLPNEVSAIVGDEFRWGAFAYPEVESVESNVEGAFANDLSYGNLSAQGIAISANTEMAEETFAFIKKMTKGEGDLLIARNCNGIPADSTNKEWPDLLSSAREAVENIKVLVNYGATGTADMQPIVKENVIKLYAGTITPEDFVDTLMSAVD